MYLFFDTETTGLSSHKDHVVQLAWMLTDSAGNIKAEECHVIRPDGYAIPTIAANIHGITTARACAIGQPLELVLNRFSNAAARATMIIAHNLTFDLGILKHDYKIANLPFPLHGKIQICTMKLSTAWCRLPKLNNTTGFKWPSLDELHYRLFGEGFDGAHDALADTHACRRCYFELVRLEVITPPNRPQETIKLAPLADYYNDKQAPQGCADAQSALRMLGIDWTKELEEQNIKNDFSEGLYGWIYDNKTKILKNNLTGMEYPPSRYERHSSMGVSGYRIFFAPDTWVNDDDVYWN